MKKFIDLLKDYDSFKQDTISKIEVLRQEIDKYTENISKREVGKDLQNKVHDLRGIEMIYMNIYAILHSTQPDIKSLNDENNN